ncbi:MAG: hypothetical protein IT303_07915 [Dehalococcoidia bacterium]|nr:hypothetical protein [Dehalococcoidia bacterium]
MREPGDSQPELPFGPIASGERPEAAGARILNESTHRSYRLIARLPDLGFEGLPTAVVHFEAPRNAIDWMQVSSPPVRWHFVPATDVPPRFALLMAALESAWSRRVP